MNFRLISILLSGSCVALIVILLTRGCDNPSTPPSDDTLWREKLEQANKVIAEQAEVIAAVQASRNDEKIRYTSDSLKQVKVVARIFKRYSEAKQEVQQITDSTGRIAAYVSVTDSLLQAKDSLYRQEVGHRLALEKLHNVEVAAMAARNVQQVELNQEYAARVASLENKLQRSEKRLDRKKLGNKILLGVAAGLGAAVTVMGLSQ